MPRYDASSARCEILTFKEGLLSAVAHDLCLRVGHFSLELRDDESIVATFDPRSLRVEHAMKDGRPAPGTLSDKQKREIEGNIAKDVLHVRRHAEIAFRSSRVTGEGDERRVEGTLTLHGTERTIVAKAQRRDGRWSTEVELHQPDYGIRPYSAMLGTLKIRPAVRVRLSVPA